MAQFTSSEMTRHFSPSASLAALGLHLRQIDKVRARSATA